MMNLSGIEESLYQLLNPVALSMGYEIVRIKFAGSGRKVLEISIDKLDQSGITIRDCKDATSQFSALLDVEDLISDKYFLEVSSAGVERPLNNPSDFARFKGRKAQIKLHNAYEGAKNLQVDIIGAEDDKILVRLSNNSEAQFPFHELKGAKLLFTAEMFRANLAKGNNKKDPQDNKLLEQ